MEIFVTFLPDRKTNKKSKFYDPIEDNWDR